jgi:hypothetical protein
MDQQRHDVRLREGPRRHAEEYRRVTEVNYLGFVHGTLAAMKRMRPRDRGVIIQVGSALAFRGIPLQAAYCASKHAIQGFTESIRAELIHDGSRVHLGSVHMPALNTPQFDWVRSKLPNRAQPVPPIYQPEVAADAIHWAAHNRRPRSTWDTPPSRPCSGSASRRASSTTTWPATASTGSRPASPPTRTAPTTSSTRSPATTPPTAASTTGYVRQAGQPHADPQVDRKLQIRQRP